MTSPYPKHYVGQALLIYSPPCLRLSLRAYRAANLMHQGLKKFFNSGGNDTRGINSDHEDKLRDQLAALDSAKDIADMDLPGWRLHPLKGKDKGRQAIWVSGNWRMTFRPSSL